MKNCKGAEDRENNAVLQITDCEIQTQLWINWGFVWFLWTTSKWFMVARVFPLWNTGSYIMYIPLTRKYMWPHHVFKSFLIAGVFVPCFMEGRKLLCCKLSSPGVQFTPHAEEATWDVYRGLGAFLDHVETSIFWSSPLPVHCSSLASQDTFAVMPTGSQPIKEMFFYEYNSTWRTALFLFSPFHYKPLLTSNSKVFDVEVSWFH